jgi:hypothetical protein
MSRDTRARVYLDARGPGAREGETGNGSAMTLNDLLQRHHVDPKTVLVLRHRPHEPALRKVLPWLA